MRGTLLLTAALAAAATGCASGSSASHAGGRPTATGAVRSTGTPTTTPGPTVQVRRMANAYVHFPVASQDLRHIVNVHGPELAAIANHGAFFGNTYPAISTNDGASWAISGPQLTRPAGDVAQVSDQIGSTSNHTIVLWGIGGRVVQTRPPGEDHWYQSGFSLPVRRLSLRRATITVTLDGGSAPEVSTDDGLRWS